MKTSFLDYYKLVLEKVSFDGQLFDKEYFKALSVLSEHEKTQLERWLKVKGFNPEYRYADRQLMHP